MMASRLFTIFPLLIFTIACAQSIAHLDIEKIMSYPLARVLERYQKDFNVSAQEAQEHERELKRYLILSFTLEDEVAMYSTQVDNFWHTFLLFTKQYQQFCHEFFGKFLHHEPMDNKKLQDDAQLLAKKQAFIAAYTDLFGQEPPAHIWHRKHSKCCGGPGHDCIYTQCCERNE